MQVLAIVSRTQGRTDADLAAYRVPEGRRVWALMKSSVIRRGWSRVDRPSAILLLEVADAGEARETVGSLPMVRDGLVDVELMELAPFLGLESLFGPQDRED